jgi:archaellum biogenesis ATPase FlaH
MELEKQKVLINCLASSRDLLALCTSIIKPSFFDPTLKKSVRFIQDYFEQHKDIPKLQVIRAETGLVLDDIGSLEKGDISYVASEIETFCRHRAITEALIEGPALLEQQDFAKIIDTMRAAISIGLQKDLGMDYFSDPEERLRQTLVNEVRISTGWPDVDALIGGGLGRQELVVFAANSGGGKSMTMLNLARNLLAQGLNGVYISLEMSESVVSKRLDSMISKVSQDNLLKEMQKVALEIEKAGEHMGKFHIKRMPENRTNRSHINAYLNELFQKLGFIPDFIIGDYLDIMGTEANIDISNIWLKDKYVSEEFRSLGLDWNAIMISASQLGRQAIEAEKLNQSHIAGGITKINTSDYTIGIKQDDMMRAIGEINFEILKARNSQGTGQRIILGWDPISLLIETFKKKTPKLELNKKKPVVLGTEGTIFKQQGNDDILKLMNTQ